MKLKTVKEILTASKKYEGEDLQALSHIAYLIRMNKLAAAENHANKLDTLLREECFVPATPDEENPRYLFSCSNTHLLTEIVNGHIDPKEIAWLELRNRGLDSNGKWVGFGEGKCEQTLPDLEEISN